MSSAPHKKRKEKVSVQRVILARYPAKLSPCILAISCSRADGCLEPSAPAIIPAPHGLPENEADHQNSSEPKIARLSHTSVNLLKVCQLRERLLVSQWNVDDTVVGEDAQGVKNGHFLSTSERPGRHEDTGVFTVKSAGCPEPTGRVPEGLPLSWEVGVSSGDTKEEGVVGGEDLRGHDWVVGFGGSVH